MLHGTGYPPERIHFVRGPVEETLPAGAPDEIALLRLDTDWYESTRHELEHLYPRLAAGGVLLVDDYGHWEGARKAVDEYFADHGDRPAAGPHRLHRPHGHQGLRLSELVASTRGVVCERVALVPFRVIRELGVAVEEGSVRRQGAGPSCRGTRRARRSRHPG